MTGPGAVDVAAVLRRVRPDDAEAREMEARVGALLQEVQAALDASGLRGRPSIQGSIAKDTWLSGSTDVDLFILMDPGEPEATLKTVAEAVGHQVLEGPRKKYAQHPYVIGEFQGATVDLVPAYDVGEAADRMSAVDRTPFHTAWVLEHLDGAARDEVRLAKQWMRGTGVYGAQTAVGGFSGYLVEILVAHTGSFEELVTWLAGGARPRRIALGPDDVDDDQSVLVVVDPVDPSRNCAAAVQEDTLARAVEAARAYHDAPADRFFFPSPARTEDDDALRRALAGAGAVWVGVDLRARSDRLDIVFPQFQKAARTITAGLEEAGFPVRRHDVWTDEDHHVAMQWVLDDVELPASRIHQGPKAGVAANADRFREKWDGHEDALGPVHEADGRLAVEVAVRARTPAAFLRAHLPGMPLGKHVRRALDDHRVLADPGDVPSPWSPIATDFILDRRPWER